MEKNIDIFELFITDVRNITEAVPIKAVYCLLVWTVFLTTGRHGKVQYIILYVFKRFD